MAEGNKNQWVVWTIIIGAVIITFIAFNYQGDKTEVVPLSELFPEEHLQRTAEVEYEYVTDEAASEQAAAKPVAVQAAQPAFEEAEETAIEIKEVVPAQTAATIEDAKPFYTIQVLSSKNKEMTEKALEKAKKNGYKDAFMITQDLKEKGIWYRIYVGKFSNKSQAENYLPTARNSYSDSFVRYVKN